MNKKILLTGTSGFIGSHLFKHILEKTNFDIVCLNRSINQERLNFSTSSIKNWEDRVVFINHDLVNPIPNIKELNNINYVINLASNCDVELSIKSPSKFIIDNVSLICNLLDWSKNQKIEKFIHLSSVEVYGPYKDNLHPEWDLHLGNNPYAASKSAQEDIIYSYWSVYNMPLAIVNTGDPFGETQQDIKYLPNTVRKILNNEKITIHASKENVPGTRQWIHAGNLADGILHCLSLDFTKYDKDSIMSKWNICGDIRFNNLEWAQYISNYLKKELKYEFVDFHSSRPGHDLHYAMSGEKIKNNGWSSPLNIFKSLNQTIDWYLDNKEWENV